MKTRLPFAKYIAPIVLALFSLTRMHAQSDVWATAYYAGWQQGYNNTGYMPAENVDYTAVTHIIHFSLVPRADGTLDDAANSVTAFNANAVVTRAHAAGRKVIISVGGWASDVAFRGATSSANRAAFVSNIVSLMRTRGYDGVDIDWETLTSGDATQYVAFITDLRNALNAVTPRPLLTSATAWQPAILALVKDKLDQINIMTYDLAGAWQGWVTWHNAALFDGGFRFPSTGGAVPTIDGMVNSFIAAGIPASKLGIGIDFYGYVWNGGTGTPNGGATEPRQTWTTAPTVQSNVSYASIMQNYFQQQYYRWDDAAQVSYLSIDNTGSANDKFISYDDEATSRRKVDYARTKGLGGVIIWELGGGYRPSMPAGQRDPLLQAVKQALNGGSSADVTPPVVSFASPLDGASLLNTVPLAATATDNIGVLGVTFSVDGSTIGTEDLSAPYGISWVTTNISNGPHTLTAQARDAAGNASSVSVNIIVANVLTDVTPPVISMTSPVSGSTVAGTADLSATASDNVGVVGVQFQVDGINVGGEIAAAPYSILWNSSNATNGSHSISAIARDAAGNRTTSSTTITVANEVIPPPPTGGTSLTIAASDNFNRPNQRPLSGGKWKNLAQQPGGGTMEIVNNALQPYNFNGAYNAGGVAWDSLLSKGSGVALTVSQKAVNSSTSALFLYVRMNNQNLPKGNGYRMQYLDRQNAPDLLAIQKVTRGTEAADLLTTTREINVGDTLRFMVSDDADKTMEVYVNSTKVLSVVDNTYDPSLWYAWVRAFVLPTIPRFDNFMLVTTATTNTQIDAELPAVSFTQPAPSSTVVGTTTVSASAADNVGVLGVQFQLDGMNVGNEITVAPYSFNWNTASATNGQHTIQAIARDAAGNSSTAAVTVTVNNIAPIQNNTWIFQDALVSPWTNTSWGASVTFGSLEQKYTGSGSIKVDQGAWGGLSLRSGSWSSPVNVSTANYESLQFAVYGGASGVTIGVLCENDMGNSFPHVNAGTVSANTWKVFTIPVSSLNPAGNTVHRVDILEESGSARMYYVDDIALVAASAGSSNLTISGVGAGVNTPSQFGLGQNYPNPFNPATRIQFTLASPALVRLEVYNIVGQRVALLMDDARAPGAYDVEFNASGFASGLYIYRLTALSMDGQSLLFGETRRMTLLK